MSDKNKKTPLEEAKLNFEEIQNFATEQAAAQLEEEVAKKLKTLFEDITININGEKVDVEKDGETIASVVDGSEHDGSIETNFDNTHEEIPGEESEEPEFMVSDDEDEIALDETIEEIIQNENMEEMNKMKMEAAPGAAPAATTASSPTPDAGAVAPDAGAVAPDAGAVAPVDENELLSKLDELINLLIQQNGGAPTEDGATAGTDQEFQVIDDEAGENANTTTPTSGTAAPLPPVQEEEIEITELDNDKNFIDEMEGQMLEIVDEDETPEEGASMEEMRSLSNTTKRTGNRNLTLTKMQDEKGHHAPVTALRESNKNKAQDESKADELLKENNSLKSEVKALRKKEKNFEDAFVNLRTQFNEMQLFNGKLALVNKVLMNGGLTTEEKIRICEQFDAAQTYEEANKLFKNIIKENKMSVIGDNKERLKGASTNTAKPKSTTEPLYESDEARRAKVLAGLIKAEEQD